MGKVKFGLIGTGRFGRLHLNVLSQIEECEVIAIADINEESVLRAQADFNVERAYTEALDLISDEEIDVVSIVSDESTHGYLAMESIKKNKHVFIEKPIATKYSEAIKISELAKKHNVQVMVGNISRFATPYFSMKKSIDRGVLGDVVTIRARRDFSKQWFQDFGKRVHPVYESGIHDIDLLLWYTGSDCQEVYAVEHNISGFKYPDSFSATLKFKNGIIATIDSAWLYPNGAPQNLVETLELNGTINADIEIIGNKGTANYELNHSGYSIWTEDSHLQPELTLWTQEVTGIGGAIKTELDHFISQVKLNKESVVAPLEDSVKALQIADAIVMSANKGSVVKLKEMIN